MAIDVTTTHCPPTAELERLVRGRLTEARAAAIAEHVGSCCGCQQRLDALAAGGSDIAMNLRECTKDTPPSDSAYYKAIAAAEDEVRATSAFLNGAADSSTDTPPVEQLALDFLQPADEPDRLGKLGTFGILRVVGRGGMGVVLHAYDPCLARDVAIKVIDPKLANNEVARQRFCREARAAAAVTHDNLVAVHQVDEDEASGLPYLVMQLVHGESLEQRLKRVGKLPAIEVARLGMQAAAGLAAAHAGGLIHRDIKPGNILLENPVDRVKLTDFGLARAVEDVKLTRTGFVAGSPLYMAPEQARGDEIDHRADLFSLGSVLYEAATGTPAFDGKTPLAVLRRVADETPQPLHSVNSDVPPWLSEIVDKLLAKNPADRYQTAGEVAEVFAAELARAHALSPLDVPAEVCPSVGSRSGIAAQSRKHICWKAVAFSVLPWLGGLALGALGLWLVWSPAVVEKVVEKEVEKATVKEISTKDLRLTFPENGKATEPVTITSHEDLAKNEVVGKTADEIKKLMDFSKEKLVVFAWGGSDGDKIAANELSTADTKTTIAFTYIRGLTRDQRQHFKLFVIPKDAEIKVEKPIEIQPLMLEGGPAPIAKFQSDSGPVWALTFLGADRLVVGFEDGNIKMWDWKKDAILKTFEPRQTGVIWTADVSADGKFLVTASDDSAVTLWNLTTLKSELSFPQPTSTKAAVFSPVGKQLATGDRNSTVRVWDWVNQIPVELRGHRGSVHALAYSPDGNRLVSAGSDGTVQMWDLRDIDWDKRETIGKPVSMSEHHGPVYGVAFSPDGTKLASCGWDGTVRIWDAALGSQLQTIRAHEGDVWSVSFGNNGKWVASAGSDGTVKVWDVATGQEVFSYRGNRPFHTVRFAKDGTTLAAGGRDGIVRVWELAK